MNRLMEFAREALLRRRSRLRASSAQVPQGAVALSEQDFRELRDIDDALTRIQRGVFGQCAQCGGALGTYRLRAIPEARYCMTCSSVLDR